MTSATFPSSLGHDPAPDDLLGSCERGGVGRLAIRRQLEVADGAQVHLVGSVGDLQSAGDREQSGQHGVLADAGGAVRLDCAVDHGVRHLHGCHLDRGHVGTRRGVALGVHQPGRSQGEEPGLVDLHPAAGHPFAYDALVGERAAEGRSINGPAAHHRQGTFGEPDRPHRVVHPSRAEPALGDRETVALGAQHVRGRHAHVGELHLAMTEPVLVAEHREVAQHLDAGCVSGDEDHALLSVRRPVGVGLAHEDDQLAVRVEDPRRVPLAAVEDVLVALAADGRGDVARVGAGHGRLGHREGRPDLAVEQRM